MIRHAYIRAAPLIFLVKKVVKGVYLAEDLKRFIKKADIESTINHLKQNFTLGICFLTGEIGDQNNVSLSSTAYNR